MQISILVSAVLVATIMLLEAPQPASAVCCGSIQQFISTFIDEANVHGPGGVGGGVKVRHHLCGDCTRPTPFCAHGGCNVAGCNCDGGCRTGDCERRRRSVDGDVAPAAYTARMLVEAGDKDGDGALSYDEAHALLNRNGVTAKMSDIKRMDADADGKLTSEEIDSN